jgi:fatty-acyl-CoA synthase
MEFINKTVGQVFEDQVALYPDEDFLIYSDRGLRFTFRAFDERVNRLAKGFLAIGVKKGDHVGIWATNVPDWLTVLFATA